MILDPKMILRIALTLAVAAGISCALTPVIKVLARKVGAMDVPKDGRRMHHVPIPRLGGLAIFISFMVSVLIFCRDIPHQVHGVLLGATIIVVLGVLDDIMTLHALPKFGVQIVAAVVVTLYGCRIEHVGGWQLPVWLSYAVTVIWIVAITNAVNFIDGLDGLACGVSTFAKLHNPKIRVIGVEPSGAACLRASLDAGHVVKLPSANTIADGTAVLEPGDKVFPYLQQNLDDVITVDDDELVACFLDMVENHKMVVENSGLLTVAAAKHLPAEGKRVVCILSGGNMDVITMSSVVQNGLIQRGRIFTVSVLLPDRPGMLVRVASVIAEQNGNVIKLEHNQFVSTNRQAAVELRVTIEAYGESHKAQIVGALDAAGFKPEIVQTSL